MEQVNATVSMSATVAVADSRLVGPLDWEANREKIARLYLNHSVKEIKMVMEKEGFFAR